MIWMALQSLTFWPAALDHPLWAESGRQVPAGGAISLAPRMTLTALAWTAPLAIFLVASRLGMSSHYGPFAMKLMLAVICLVAAFGLAVEANDLGSVGIAAKEHYRGWVTGTFVNRNTAAAFFAIGIAMALALSLEDVKARRPHSHKTALQAAWAWAGSRQGVHGLLAVFLWFAAVMTGSRGGVLAASAGIGLILLLVLTKSPRPGRRVALWLWPLPLAGMGLAIFVLLERADNAASSNISRLSLYREAIAAISDRPLLGHGAGAYEAVQPLYHLDTTPSYLLWNHAHSGALELMAGMGIPVAMPLIAAFLALTVYLARSYRRAKVPSPASLAAAAALTATGIHALYDFSLETQAVALYVAVLAGLGTGEAARPSPPS
ncbi:MAG: O-antigen ligase family protein [Hyphomicrobiales bacterium]